MKVFWIIIVVFTLAIVLLISKCSMSLYDEVANFPEYAKKDVVYKQFSGLISGLDIAIESSSSQLSLAASIEKITLNDEIILVRLDKLENEPLIVKQKNNSENSRTIIMNGSGYGVIDEQDILIIDYPINRHGIENCLIYIKHDKVESK